MRLAFFIKIISLLLQFKKKAKQLGATSAEYAQATVNLVNPKTPEKRAAIMGMQNSHPCKALFVEEDEEEEAYFDIASELGIVANEELEHGPVDENSTAISKSLHDNVTVKYFYIK